MKRTILAFQIEGDQVIIETKTRSGISAHHIRDHDAPSVRRLGHLAYDLTKTGAVEIVPTLSRLGWQIREL